LNTAAVVSISPQGETSTLVPWERNLSWAHRCCTWECTLWFLKCRGKTNLSTKGTFEVHQVTDIGTLHVTQTIPGAATTWLDGQERVPLSRYRPFFTCFSLCRRAVDPRTACVSL